MIGVLSKDLGEFGIFTVDGVLWLLNFFLLLLLPLLDLV